MPNSKLTDVSTAYAATSRKARKFAGADQTLDPSIIVMLISYL